MKAQELLSATEQNRIIKAIKEAERNTSGEIRIHLDDVCETDPVLRAEEVFLFLGMEKTSLRNGILIYLACESKVFAIIGDKGINEVVPQGFWRSISDRMSDCFRRGDFAQGLEDAVLSAGEKLKEFFPYKTNDVNELPDDLSFGHELKKRRSADEGSDK